MLIVFLLGFSSGLPIMVFYKTLKIWLRREGIELSTIGFFSWITTFYSFNFAWAFLLDKFSLTKLGRRRSWMILTQLGLMTGFASMTFADPKVSLTYIAIVTLVLCFFSATQDIAVDAYRREILSDEELGVGAALSVYGYRIGMLVASGFALWTVDKDTLGLSFQQSFWILVFCMGVGLFASLWADKAPVSQDLEKKSLSSFIIEPFVDFFRRPGAAYVFFFILFYKLGDAMGGSMLSPFYVDLGFSNKIIAEVTSGVGFVSTLVGLFLGGIVLFRLGYFWALLIFGIFQSVSTALFGILSMTGASIPALSFVVAIEDLSAGMGTAALVAFMGHLTNKNFTAAQYALFASLASISRTLFAGYAGVLVEKISYAPFFVFCSVIALPGVLLVLVLKRKFPETFQSAVKR
ncbi:AmpG family muropeptide MFS transporter [bacterium]|nr:AmpG family muropeptide MFS transporter [bacterium]